MISLSLSFIIFLSFSEGILRSGNTDYHITAKIDLLSSHFFSVKNELKAQLSKEENYHIFLYGAISPIKNIETKRKCNLFNILLCFHKMQYGLPIFFFILPFIWLSEWYDTNKNYSLDSLVYRFGYMVYWISEISLYSITSLLNFSVDFNQKFKK